MGNVEGASSLHEVAHIRPTCGWGLESSPQHAYCLQWAGVGVRHLFFVSVDNCTQPGRMKQVHSIGCM